MRELINDDGISKRYIYWGVANEDEINPSAEIDHVEWLVEDTLPEGKNKHHMLATVACPRKVWLG